MRDIITSIADLIGLLAIAIGLTFAAGYLVGPASIAIGGVVLLAGVRVIVWQGQPDQAPAWWRRLRKGGGRA